MMATKSTKPAKVIGVENRHSLIFVDFVGFVAMKQAERIFKAMS
jgi:hypothetical protein